MLAQERGDPGEVGGAQEWVTRDLGIDRRRTFSALEAGSEFLDATAFGQGKINHSGTELFLHFKRIEIREFNLNRRLVRRALRENAVHRENRGHA